MAGFTFIDFLAQHAGPVLACVILNIIGVSILVWIADRY